MSYKWICKGYFLLTALFCLLSCTKKGDFIDEGRTGDGIHYTPLILNNNLYDTITHKYLNLKDATFSPGQKIIFEIDYFSQDSVSSLELWAGKSLQDLHKSLDIPYRNTFYSATKFADTVLFHYELPGGLDSASVSKWYLQPRVITVHNLKTTMDAAILIR